MRILMAAVCTALATTPALATTLDPANLTRSVAGYTYFHKTGADKAAHDAAVNDCLKDAGKTNQPVQSSGAGAAYGLLGVLVEAAVMGVADSMAENRGVAANLENCMVVHGWDVVSMDEAIGAEITKLDQVQQSARLSSWVGAPEPQGRIVRRYSNDILDPNTRWNGPTSDLDKVSLSYSSSLRDPPAPKVATPPLPKMEKAARPTAPVKPKAISSVSATETVVVVRMVWKVGASGGAILQFTRPNLESGLPAWTDGATAEFSAPPPQKFLPKAGETFEITHVYRVPAGRWRLSGGVQAPMFLTNFCLGAPAFDVGEGEAVFAGSFIFDGRDQFVPDLSIAPAQAALATAPAVAGRLKPASYINGTTSECGGATIYALELPDTPYVAEYALGTKAPPASAVMTATADKAPENPLAPPAPTPVQPAAPEAAKEASAS